MVWEGPLVAGIPNRRGGKGLTPLVPILDARPATKRRKETMVAAPRGQLGEKVLFGPTVSRSFGTPRDRKQYAGNGMRHKNPTLSLCRFVIITASRGSGISAQFRLPGGTAPGRTGRGNSVTTGLVPGERLPVPPIINNYNFIFGPSIPCLKCCGWRAPSTLRVVSAQV